MKVTYLEQPVSYRLPNNVVDFTAYRNARLAALPASCSSEPLPVLHLNEEERSSAFQRFGMAMDAVASLAMSVAALVVLFAVVL